MLLTTSQEDITPLVKKLSISASTESENLLINVLVSKVSLYSTPLVVVLDLDLDHSSLKDFQLITVRNPNSVSLFTHLHKSLLLLLNHTTPFFQPILFLNILMLLLCLITKLSMISVEELSILKDQPIPTLTDLLLKLSPHLLLPLDSMVPLMLISLNSKPILYHIQEFTLCFPLMLQLSLLRKLIMNNFQLLKSLTPLLNPLQ